ncbi:MAG: hypothetical protein ABEK50_10260 [bacterium]
METRERNLLIGLGIAAVVAGIYYGLLPMYNEYVSLKSKIDKNVNDISNAQAQASQLEKLLKELESTIKKLKLAQQKLPEQGRFRELMSIMESQARKTDIPDRKILKFSQGSRRTIKGGLVREMSISARFQSISMGQLIEMLWRFDNMIRMMDIKSFRNFSLQRVSEGDQFLYNVNMDMTVFILRDTDSTQEQEA